MGNELGCEGEEFRQRCMTGEGRVRRVREMRVKGRMVSRVRFTERREGVGGRVGVKTREVRGCIYGGG